jgi:hypothetical protein
MWMNVMIRPNLYDGSIPPPRRCTSKRKRSEWRYEIYESTSDSPTTHRQIVDADGLELFLKQKGLLLPVPPDSRHVREVFSRYK